MGTPNSLLKRFDPGRIADILDAVGWSQEEEIETLVNIARQTEVKALPAALAAWKLLRDRQIEALQFSGLIQRLEGRVTGSTPGGQHAQITSTSYQLGSHTQDMLRKAYGTAPALPVLEGVIEDGESESPAPPVGECSVQAEAPVGGCAGESTPESDSPGLVEQANRRDRGTTDVSTPSEGEQFEQAESEAEESESKPKPRRSKPGTPGVQYGHQPPSVFTSAKRASNPRSDGAGAANPP